MGILMMLVVQVKKARLDELIANLVEELLSQPEYGAENLLRFHKMNIENRLRAFAGNLEASE
jgi:hypothetical protein